MVSSLIARAAQHLRQFNVVRSMISTGVTAYVPSVNSGLIPRLTVITTRLGVSLTSTL